MHALNRISKSARENCVRPPLLFFFVIERSVLMALVFYNKDMLEKVTTQRTKQFSNFSKSKEPS